MFSQILAKLHAQEIAYRDDLIETQRKFLRHEGSAAEVMVAGRPYALRDWSLGGVLFETPRPDVNLSGIFYEYKPFPQLQPGDRLRLALRFHLLDESVEIPLEAQILRSTERGTVARFLPLSAENRRSFARVADLQNAKAFLESQNVGAGSNNNRLN